MIKLHGKNVFYITKKKKYCGIKKSVLTTKLLFFRVLTTKFIILNIIYLYFAYILPTFL